MAAAMPLDCILTVTAVQDNKEQYFESSCATHGLQGLLSVAQRECSDFFTRTGISITVLTVALPDGAYSVYMSSYSGPQPPTDKA